MRTDPLPPEARVGVGLVGLSGYAGALCRLLRERQAAPDGLTRLAGVFALDAADHAPLLGELQREGTAAHADYDELLADPAVEVVWLPLPIHLHRPMAERALRAGKRVFLEKPVAGSLQDHDALAAAERAAADEAGAPAEPRVLVGFQDVYRASNLALKRRLLAGGFGAPRVAVVHGRWPRPASYYRRNGWAGALERSGAWVLDSPLSNAMAHYVNLAFFLLGPTEAEAAEPVRVEAELFRARPEIETFDTCSLRVTLASGVELVVLLSHTTAERADPTLEVDTDRGTLRVGFTGEATFTPASASASASGGAGGEPEVLPPPTPAHEAMADAAAALVRGGLPTGVSTLANARPHSLLVSAVSEAAGVVPIEADPVERDGEAFLVVPGLDDRIRDAAAGRLTLGEAGFPARPGALGLRGYAAFGGPAG